MNKAIASHVNDLSDVDGDAAHNTMNRAVFMTIFSSTSMGMLLDVHLTKTIGSISQLLTLQ